MVLLASMAAELSPERYVFCTFRAPKVARDIEALASVVEPEELALVTTQEQWTGPAWRTTSSRDASRCGCTRPCMPSV